jgi:hypothetical protein
MRHLTKDEVVQFYAAYRAMEATASSLRNEVVQFYAAYRAMEATASSLRNEVERLRRNFLTFVLVTLYLGFGRKLGNHV